MERDPIRELLYSLARFGLFWLINVFGVIIGKTAILGIFGTFLPRLALYDNPETLSVISFIIPICMLIALFADDAKRHTAYGVYNPILVAITMIVTAAVYYIPAVVIGYVKDVKTAGLMKELYFTSYWLSSLTGDDVEIYALMGTALMLIICILSYVIARKIYLRKFENGEYEYQY